MLWRIRVGTGSNHPSVAGDDLCFAQLDDDSLHETVKCVDANTGKEKWSHTYEVPPVWHVGWGELGVRATPTITDKYVYAWGPSGMASALNGRPGRSSGNTTSGKKSPYLNDECLCCPDPCYQPRWIPEANAAFFTDYARPRTVTRLRWDHAPDLVFPDRSEFFWAHDDGKGLGPQPPHAFPKSGSKHPFHPGLMTVQYKGERAVKYDQLYMYQEAATARASFFIEYSYRSNYPLLTQHFAGFSDLYLGTKALLLDCELIQLTFQFKTYLPTGNATKGLGTGHVSLEPSLLTSVRLASETYFQGQLSEWIPIGGDPTYAGVDPPLPR